MLKLSKNALGLLNSQYRSVLKKCMFINMLAAGIILCASNAFAAGESYDSSDATALDKIKNMGTAIAPNEDVGALFVHNPSSGTNYLTKEEYTLSGVHDGAWLVNMGGEVGVGYTYSGGSASPASGTTTISNKHNAQDFNDVPTSGGAILNRNLSGGANPGGTLNIRNSKFSSNSSTFLHEDTYVLDTGLSAGGAVTNISRLQTNIVSTTFEANYVMDYVRAAGGAVYNGPVYTNPSGTTAVGNIISLNNQYTGNHVGNQDSGSTTINAQWAANVLNNEARTQITDGGVTGGISDSATGGALVNEGKYTSTNDSFSSNYAYAKVAKGGAVYNAVANLSKPDYDLSYVLLTLNGSDNFSGNYAKSNEVYSKDGQALGGAIYNDASMVISDGSVQTYTSNYADSQKDSQGGAIYNGVNGTIDTIRANTTFNGNYVKNRYTAGSAKGGAIANFGVIKFDDAIFISNSASGAVTLGGAIYNNNTVTATKISNFTGNTATGSSRAEGGAIYNDVSGTIQTITGSVFSANKVTSSGGDAKGGAIANYGTTLKLGRATFDANTANGKSLSSDTHASYGGAIYNAAGAEIQIDPSAVLVFKNNKAYKGKGGAIYNAGNIEATNFTGSLTFRNNVESDTQGGAVYNANGATINLDLKAGSGAEVNFSKADDSVYNDGTITISGHNPVPTLNVNNLLSGGNNTVSFHSDVEGSGTYNISNADINVGSDGRIKYGPKMVLANNKIHMADGSRVYLNSSQENASNGYTNNFYTVEKDARLYYRNDGITDGPVATQIINKGTVYYLENASNSGQPIEVATAMKNSGVLDVASKGVLTNVHIDNLISDKGNKILVNMDNPNLKADVLHVQDKIANDTNIVFKNMEGKDIGTVTLDEGQRILFAETSQENASFKTNANVNARKRGYLIDIKHYDEGSIWRWYLERGQEVHSRLAMSNLPRAAIEQLRSLPLNATRTNRGQCSCYADNCNNAYCQYESSRAKSRLWITPFYRQGSFDKPFENDFDIKGVDFGYDFQPTHSDMYGIFGSFRSGNYETKGKSKKFTTEDAKSELDMTSILAGLYYRKYIGDLYMLGAAYAGKLDVDMKASNPHTKSSVDGLVIGGQAEIGYDIHTSKRSTFTPSLRATYNYINFDDAKDSFGQKYAFEDTHNIELEAAIKYEYQFNNEYQLPTTGYIKPSVIQTINTNGKVKITDDFGVQEPSTLDNETLGRIEIGADTEIFPRFSIGAFGNYTFGTDYNAWGVGGNIRYIW